MPSPVQRPVPAPNLCSDRSAYASCEERCDDNDQQRADNAKADRDGLLFSWHETTADKANSRTATIAASNALRRHSSMLPASWGEAAADADRG
jgi:hypothetical protein